MKIWNLFRSLSTNQQNEVELTERSEDTGKNLKTKITNACEKAWANSPDVNVAVKRVEDCFDKESYELDLKNLSLNKLPPELSELPSVTDLHIENNQDLNHVPGEILIGHNTLFVRTADDIANTKGTDVTLRIYVNNTQITEHGLHEDRS